MNKEVLKNISYGMYIVTSKDNDIKSGCVVNTVVQITSKDLIFAISINKNNYTNEIIRKSKKVAISILNINTNKELINKFGFKSSRVEDKFIDTNYEIIDDVPVVLEGVNAYLIGDVIDIISVLTHDIFLVSINKSELLNDIKSLTYKDYQINMKGRSSINAPTYVEENMSKSNSAKYRCMVCGHIYDDAIESIKFNDLPDDWVCPICGVGKDKFERIN